MGILFYIIATLIAIEHIYILVLEMFMTTSKKVIKTFDMEEKFIQQVSAQRMLKNQGLYNGFLAFGILGGLYIFENIGMSLFLISCVAVAGTYAGITVKRKIFFMQALPAYIALIIYLLE